MSKFITFQQKMSKAIKKWAYNTREELKFAGKFHISDFNRLPKFFR